MKSQGKRNAKKNNTKSYRPINNFLAEAGLLKRVKRSGWWVVGISDGETVAEHSFRCAMIGYFLAHQEKVDPYKVLVMTLFNDIHEARINDLHKMGHYYIDFKSAEKKAFKDQIRFLDKRIKSELENLRLAYDNQNTKAAIVARDADILECLLQAKEYFDQGYRMARSFFYKAPAYLKTRSARRLWEDLKRWDSRFWWKNITKFER